MTTTKPPVLTDDEKDRIYNAWQDKRDEASYGDLIDAIEQAVLERAGADAWQPIETAPRQGMILLGRAAEGEGDDRSDAICTPGYWQEGWDDSIDDMGCNDGFVDSQYQIFSPPRKFGAEKYRTDGTQPTHWMPLPAGPDALKGTPAAAVADANPHPSGSVREGWQRGYENRPMLAAPGSDYARAYKEGSKARATPHQAAQPPAAIPRALLGRIVDEVFDGGCEDTSVVEDIYHIVVAEYGSPQAQQLSGNAGEVDALERQALIGLLDLAYAAYLVAEDSMDDENPDFIHVDKKAMETMNDALDKLEALPDDCPGYALAGSAPAKWALRRLFGFTTMIELDAAIAASKGANHG